MPESTDVCLDCEEGRKLGCATFCCRLIVRLTPEERARGVPGVGAGMNCVPKAADGLCVHLDRESSLCKIWKERPRVCREYDCNEDDLSSIVLKRGFSSLVSLVSESARLGRRPRIRVPRRRDDGERQDR